MSFSRTVNCRIVLPYFRIVVLSCILLHSRIHIVSPFLVSCCRMVVLSHCCSLALPSLSSFCRIVVLSERSLVALPSSLSTSHTVVTCSATGLSHSLLFYLQVISSSFSSSSSSCILIILVILVLSDSQHSLRFSDSQCSLRFGLSAFFQILEFSSSSFLYHSLILP